MSTLELLKRRGFALQPFQEEVWNAVQAGQEGLLIAPTGSGKTYAVFFPLLEQCGTEGKKLTLLWITPLRALANDIAKALQAGLDLVERKWSVRVRSADTSQSERATQRRQMPEVLITTPESLHLLFTQEDSPQLFSEVKAIVVDEWHEFLGTKRGVMIELALARIRHWSPEARVWGLSATVGNPKEALETLLPQSRARVILQPKIEKKVKITIVLPRQVERYPWAGHSGVQMRGEIQEIISRHHSTLIFTNTRSQAELWYQNLLEDAPELASVFAIHHGSLEKEIRESVERDLKEGKLRAVVCTSSLDLGVDLPPVEGAVQIGSPKSVARTLQRAGRSGHAPGQESVLYFIPTHALEIFEAQALRELIEVQCIESRLPVSKPLDFLVQYLVTLAIGAGFSSEELYCELLSTHAYASLTPEEWQWALSFVTTGGTSLYAYPEYRKVEIEEGIYRVREKSIALRHKLSIGTILSDPLLKVQYLRGGYIGHIEESFIARLKRGDVFYLGGKALEYVQLRDMTVRVRNASSKNAIIPRWMGGRLQLSSEVGIKFRSMLQNVHRGTVGSPEEKALLPLWDIQARGSHIPSFHELLGETFHSKEGYHLYLYPFAGRGVHELMALLFAQRLAEASPRTCTFSMNDYGFEILSNKPFDSLEEKIPIYLSPEGAHESLKTSLNFSEIAKRRFREVARVAGLVFTGFPHKTKSVRDIQASSSLFYDVFKKYDSENKLLIQAYDEALREISQGGTLYSHLEELQQRTLVIKPLMRMSPLSFLLMADRLRETLTHESYLTRIESLLQSLENEGKNKKRTLSA